MTAIYELPELGQEVFLHTVLRFRDEQPELFAFTQLQQRALFMQLIKVNGIGPRMALAILSGMTVASFIKCVHDGDIAYLTTIPGVGKKTAQRLLIEMRDRIDKSGIEGGDDAVAMRSGSPEAEAISALVALGYNAREARLQVQSCGGGVDGGGDLDSEALIRAALKRFAKI